MTKLYPRLAPSHAVELWEELHLRPVEALRNVSASTHPNEYFAAVGGRRVVTNEIDLIARDIRGLAEKFGYPDTRGRAMADFDTEVSIYLGSAVEISPGEAYRPETWAFLSLIVLPDVVKWRFQGFNISRCTGGRRDCFHRLWLRAKAFDLGEGRDNRWILLRNLTEDAFVSIIERPSLAGNYTLCKVLGLSWMKTASKVGRGAMEDLNRRAIKRIRSKGTIIYLDALPYEALKSIVEQCYSVESMA